MNLLIIAFVFVVAGYAIEAAIVPFHFWLPDAYTAAPAPSSAFLSALVDQGSYYILIRILLFIIIPPSVRRSIRLDYNACSPGSLNHDSWQHLRLNPKQHQTPSCIHLRRRRRLQPRRHHQRNLTWT